ncbi:MAG: hypothetical protein WA634_07980 [Silvibacterium sp.]
MFTKGAAEQFTLLNQTGEPSTALQLLTSRRFQPWEGGEGLVLAQYVRASLLIGKRLLQDGYGLDASRHFQAALRPPRNLSEAWHLLANASDIYFWIGIAEHTVGNESAAREHLSELLASRAIFNR